MNYRLVQLCNDQWRLERWERDSRRWVWIGDYDRKSEAIRARYELGRVNVPSHRLSL